MENVILYYVNFIHLMDFNISNNVTITINIIFRCSLLLI